MEKRIEGSKILVQVQSIDNMIKSGRFSVRAGTLAKRAGLKPIITLDEEGKGALLRVAFSMAGIGFFFEAMGDYQLNWIAAAIFYLIFILGIVFFVIHPALEKGSWTYALFAGLLFGFITYATYDLTNLATIKNWSLKITIIDLIWGTSLGGLVSIITFFFLKR